MNRRDFIAAAGAMTWALSSRAAEQRRTAAIIGHTGSGDYGHGLDAVFNDLPGVRVVAVADANPEGGEKTRAKIGAPKAYASFKEMLVVEKPDMVSVAPRHSEEHFAMLSAALNAGAHVICEKPFTTDLREADEILRLAQNRGLRIAVAHQIGLSPNIQKLREEIANGILGEITQMRAYGKQDSRAGGEDLIVLGTHLFDLMRQFAGDPEQCTARVWHKGRLATKSDARHAGEKIGPILGDEVEAQFMFPRGVVGTFTSRAKLREAIGRWRLELIGSKRTAFILMDIDPEVHLFSQSDGKREPLPPATAEKGFGPANRRLVLDFLKSIEEKRDPICSGANGAKAVEMAHAIWESHLNGRTIEFPLARREHPLR